MSDTTVYVTQDTFDKMREQLQKMKSVERPAASRAIGEAREKGDLKENAEYDSAKEAQGMLEAKIKQLEAIHHDFMNRLPLTFYDFIISPLNPTIH